MKEIHYFIYLERELDNSFSFIEPDQANMAAYSAKFASLLNSICIEFESLSKSLIKCFRKDEKVGNIADIKRNILELFPNFCKNEIEISRTQEIRNPFLNWDNGDKLKWWGDYVDVKHDRNSNFHKANLNNVLEAMSALAIIIVYVGWFRDENFHIQSSGLFFHKSMGGSLVHKGENPPDVKPL